MQHQAQLQAARTPDGYNFTDSYRYVAPLIRQADLAVANLEVPLGGRPYAGYPAFNAPDVYAVAARNAGFDILLTANNHALDRGGRGLERTIRALDSLDVIHTGTFVDSMQRARRYPLLVEKNGFRLVFLNYTEWTNGLTPTPPNIVNYIEPRARIRQDVETAKALHPDAIIACMHWGVEYKTIPSTAQQTLADELLKMGVSHIIGSHPHVVQPIEIDTIAGEPHVVAYSLGNYISNMSATNTDGGLMLYLTIEKDDRGTRLVDMRTETVWVARPALGNRRTHTIIPESLPADSLSPAEQRRRAVSYRNILRAIRKN
jgi:poly-gamma-glutamate synthesis protein (capsule biosynthesis protein)